MERVAVVAAVRTPVGKFGGALKDVQASTLGATVLREAVRRAGIDPAEVDDVIMGHVLTNGETPNVARMAALEAGFPVEVPAYTLDRQCGSGLQAIVNGAMQIQTGNARVVLAGGVESESNAEYYVTGARWGLRLGTHGFKDRLRGTDEMVSCPARFGPIPGMIHTAEVVAERYAVSREEQDLFALRSHRGAVAAADAGKFEEEIVPVEVEEPKRGKVVVDRDEQPRADTSLEALAKLPPVRGKTVTAGNSSSINDGAAV